MKRKIGVYGLFAFLGLLSIVLFFGASVWAQKGKPPKPPQPPADPAIAYSVFGPNRMDLMVMNADGSNQRAVVSEKMVENVNPDWSPDGKQLVFTRFCLKGGCNGIYIVNVDGTGLRKVLDFNFSGSYTNRVVWSPVPLGDGQYKIAFVDRARLPDGSLKADSDLFMVNLDGTGLVQLTDTLGIKEWEAEWSPSADRIAIETYDPAEPPCDLVVYQIGYDGSKFSATFLGSVIRQSGSLLGPDTAEVGLNDWAKTQDKLLVWAMIPPPIVSPSRPDLWTIDVTIPSSPIQLQLTFTPDHSEGAASWSPDDSKIVFLKDGYQFWVMNCDGSGAKQISSANGVWFKTVSWRRNL